jgi:hypothetical protein
MEYGMEVEGSFASFFSEKADLLLYMGRLVYISRAI